MKGIIADIKGKYAVILTQDGLFKRVRALPGMSVGMETELEQASNGAVSRRRVMKIASIAAVSLLALGVGFGAYSYTVPYSYIDLDINPSIELTVNIYDMIIDTEALNEDGGRLLLDKELKHKKLDRGVSELLNSAIQQGYLKTWSESVDTSKLPSDKESQSTGDSGQASGDGNQGAFGDNSQLVSGDGNQTSGNGTQTGENISQPTGKQEGTTGEIPSAGQDAGNLGSGAVSGKKATIENAVMFTVSSNNVKKSNELKKKIENTATKKLDEDKVNSEILVGEASVEQRDAARKLGVTPGKLVLIEDALKHIPEKKLNDIKNTAVKDLIEIARKNTEKAPIEKDGSPKNSGSSDKASYSEKGANSANVSESENTSNSDKNNNKSDEGNKKDKGNIGNVVKGQSGKTDDSQYTGNNSNNSTNKDKERDKDNSSNKDKGNSRNKDKGKSSNNNSNDKYQSDKINGFNVKDVLEKSSEALKKEREILKDEFLSQIKNSKNDKTDKTDKSDKNGKNDKNDKNDRTDKNQKNNKTDKNDKTDKNSKTDKTDDRGKDNTDSKDNKQGANDKQKNNDSWNKFWK